MNEAAAPSRKILPDGRSRIHWCIRDEDGPICALPINLKAANRPLTIKAPGHTYRIACAPQHNNLMRLRFTDDPRAATCPECEATEEHKAALAAAVANQEEG